MKVLILNKDKLKGIVIERRKEENERDRERERMRN